MRFLGAIFFVISTYTTTQAAETADKFRLDGATLYYDSINLPDGESSEIADEDKDFLLKVLRENNGITTLHLNSDGGAVWAGEEMARIVIDFELDTVVEGECSSSCVSVFLAGQQRILGRGGKIGFHGRNWSSSSVERYYEGNKDRKGWSDPFDFGSWIYRDTQDEVFDELTYMVGRGVDPAFAIETIRIRNSMWYPSRQDLQKANVLRD